MKISLYSNIHVYCSTYFILYTNISPMIKTPVPALVTKPLAPSNPSPQVHHKSVNKSRHFFLPT